MPAAAPVAVALYVAYWIAVLFGYIRLDSSDFSDGVFELLRALAVLLPPFALGFAVGRWRALLAGLVFLAAVVVPERTVVDGDGVDVTLIGNYGVSLGEALALLAVTTPCVLLGVVARRARATRPASRPTSG
jgi:ABC-type transport system involved in cytochrome c biogenesis permease component